MSKKLKVCHGCYGRGWVDITQRGAVICPVCRGTGKVVDKEAEG